MKKRNLLLVALLLIAASSVLFAGATAEVGPDGLKPATYSWVAGDMGGGWYTQAGAMSEIVKTAVPAITTKVLPGGGTANPLAIENKQHDFAWGVGYVDRAAANGVAPLYDHKVQGLSGLLGGFSVDFYHFFAAQNTGVTTIEQLVAKIKAGERINIAAPRVGTSERALTSFIFEYYGTSYEQIEKNGGRVEYAIYGDMVNLYKDRHVDYVIACLGLPGAAITEMALSRPSTILAASDELVQWANKTYGTVAWETGLNVIPGGTYKGIDRDIQAIGHSTEIICRTDLDENVAYHFTKALIENIDKVQNINPSFAKYFTAEAAPSTMVPLHPGAERYYKEAGLL